MLMYLTLIPRIQSMMKKQINRKSLTKLAGNFNDGAMKSAELNEEKILLWEKKIEDCASTVQMKVYPSFY